MTEHTSLRERKKAETRDRIRRAALELFAASGFERVTVARIAGSAEVSQATVFNYFPTKEDLVIDGMAAYGRRLVASLRDRPAGVSVLEAFRAHLLVPRGALAHDDPAEVEALVGVRRIIAESPALQARELLISATMARELAEVLADGPPASVAPRFLATAMVGITQAMTEEVHRLAAAGRSGTQIAAIVLPAGADAVDVLARGIDTDSHHGRRSPE